MKILLLKSKFDH